MMLERRRDVRQEHIRRPFVELRQMRRELLEHAQFRQQRAAIVHVHFVFARPMECFSGLNLQPRQIHAVLAVQRDITLREIVSDHTHHAHGRKETGRHRGMTGGTSQQTRVRCRWCFNGIKGRRPDDKNAHICLSKGKRGGLDVDEGGGGARRGAGSRSLNCRQALTTSGA
jgi:hypothetical protein